MKTTEVGGAERGYDAGKKVPGRKRLLDELVSRYPGLERQRLELKGTLTNLTAQWASDGDTQTQESVNGKVFTLPEIEPWPEPVDLREGRLLREFF